MNKDDLEILVQANAIIKANYEADVLRAEKNSRRTFITLGVITNILVGYVMFCWAWDNPLGLRIVATIILTAIADLILGGVALYFNIGDYIENYFYPPYPEYHNIIELCGSSPQTLLNRTLRGNL